MNFTKKLILAGLALLPIKAISFAADFQERVDIGQVDELDMFQELGSWYNNDILPDFYYRDLEKEGVFQFEDLDLPEQKNIRQRVLKKFTKDWVDNKLSSSATNSAVPD